MIYRRDIDGLRALAVAPVVIYHLRIPLGESYFLPGGFLGVDIFFVLSGFLITKIILEEMARTGGLSLGDFYIRRARRILPALFAVIFASIAVGAFILTPTEMTRLTESAMAAMAFVSNAYWFFELESYGAQGGLVQPLLHTWSLAIEEQFYLIFPLLLMILKPPKRPVVVAVVIATLIIASLIMAERTTAWLQPMSFYSPLSRAWEVLAGALLALALTHFPDRVVPGAVLRAIVPKISVAVIAVCMVMIDLDQVSHPGLITAPVVLATLGLLWCAQGAEITTQVLSSGPLVWIGQLSYSIYLWHFPVFAYGRLTTIEVPGPGDMAIWLAVTLLLSVAGYYGVERPFRHKFSPRAFMLCLSGAVIAVTAVFMLGTRTEVLSAYRAAQLSAVYGGDYFDTEAMADQAWEPLNTRATQTQGGPRPGARMPSGDETQRLWFENPGTLNILVIGNSHSRDMFNVMAYAMADFPGVDVARFGMLTLFPDFQRQALLASPNFAAADVVMIASRYNDRGLDGVLNALIDDLQGAGKRVVLVGNAAEFTSPGQVALFDYVTRGGTQAGEISALDATAYHLQNPRVGPLNETLQEIAQAHGVIYLSRWDLMCSAEQEACRMRLPGGGRTLYDHNHLTLEGARFMADRVIEMEWLGPVME